MIPEKTNSMERAIILLRGLPGSGKSTLAHFLAREQAYPVFSVDDFFTDVNGVYSFDYLRNHEAYKACEEKAREAIRKGIHKIFIANTFTMEWEMEPYFKMAADAGYGIFVITVENLHGGKNVHEIPEEHIEKMREKYRIRL